MIVAIQGDASLEEINEALSLINVGATPYEEPEPYIDPAWENLPKTGSQRQAVLLSLLEREQTRDEIAAALDFPDSAVDGRVIELRGGGWVTETGEKRDTSHGKPAAVLTVTEKAQTKIRLTPTKWFPNGERP